MPSAGEIVNAWPDEVIDRIDERTVVVTLSHEERLDVPAVAAALERRRAKLGELGFSESDLERIHGPAGLDLGGRSPAQVALAIAAEIVAETSGGRKKSQAAPAPA